MGLYNSSKFHPRSPPRSMKNLPVIREVSRGSKMINVVLQGVRQSPVLLVLTDVSGVKNWLIVFYQLHKDRCMSRKNYYLK